MNIKAKRLRGKQMIDIFKALAEESRLRILALLLDGEMCVCEIEDVLNMTQSNVSRHLTALKSSGIIACNKSAQWAFYGISESFKTDYPHLWLQLEEKLTQTPYTKWKEIRDRNAKSGAKVRCLTLQP
jgi:ArsR family transcriptional regulator